MAVAGDGALPELRRRPEAANAGTIRMVFYDAVGNYRISSLTEYPVITGGGAAINGAVAYGGAGIVALDSRAGMSDYQAFRQGPPGTTFVFHSSAFVTFDGTIGNRNIRVAAYDAGPGGKIIRNCTTGYQAVGFVKEDTAPGIISNSTISYVQQGFSRGIDSLGVVIDSAGIYGEG